MSSIHVALEMKYPVKMASLLQRHIRHFETVCLSSIAKTLYVCVKFVEGTSIMTSSDLFYIRCLVDKNYELGCYFLMDKFRVGRCTEGTTVLLFEVFRG